MNSLLHFLYVRVYLDSFSIYKYTEWIYLIAILYLAGGLNNRQYQILQRRLKHAICRFDVLCSVLVYVIFYKVETPKNNIRRNRRVS